MRMVLRSCLCFIILLALIDLVSAFYPSRHVLSLNGIDDYAILPFEEYGFLFPQGTDEFTVEMWIHPIDGPGLMERDIIATQQVGFSLRYKEHQWCNLYAHDSQLCGIFFVRVEGDAFGGVHGVVYRTVPLWKDEWNYVALILKDSTLTTIDNDRIIQSGKVDIMDRVSTDANRIIGPPDLLVGGYPVEEVFPSGEVMTNFHGEIDAIRFSDIARYELPGEHTQATFEPPLRFEADEHTVVLWQFDEAPGDTLFEDASGNGRTLIGMNGASISEPLAVEPSSCLLTTVWGRVRLGSR